MHVGELQLRADTASLLWVCLHTQTCLVQVHLGFFSTEQQAAKAYDRAAINKGARDGGKIITNFELADYARELETLHSISQEELVAALANEQCAQSLCAGCASGLGPAWSQPCGGPTCGRTAAAGLPALPPALAAANGRPAASPGV